MAQDGASDELQMLLQFDDRGTEELHAALAATQPTDSLADTSNIADMLAYVNQTLQIYGFPAPIKLQAASDSDVARTLNSIFALLKQRQDDLSFREEATQQMQKQKAEIARLQSRLTEMRGSLDDAERDKQQLLHRQATAEATSRRALEKVNSEKDELVRQVQQLQSRDVQYKHEIRKKENEHTRLQERLNQLLTDKDRAFKAGIEILNTLQKQGPRATWGAGKKSEEEMYKAIVTALEEKQKQLLRENDDLRRTMRTLQTELQDALTSQFDSAASEGVLSPARFDMPFDVAGAAIEESIRKKLVLLKARLQQTERAGSAKSEEELRTQIEEYKAVIAQQDALLEMRLAAPVTPVRYEQTTTPGEWRRLEEARSRLHSDQQRLAADAVRLAAERVQLMDQRLGQHDREPTSTFAASPFASPSPFRSASTPGGRWGY